MDDKIESSPVRYRGTLARLSVEFKPEYFRQSDRALAEDLCHIMAEVFSFNERTSVMIGGEALPAGMIQMAYARLTVEHLQMVIDNFRAVGHSVKFKKTYLRTALYNAAFELGAQTINQLSGG